MAGQLIAVLSWLFTKSRQCEDVRRNHSQFGFYFESQLQKHLFHQHEIIVLLHTKLKWKKTLKMKEATHIHCKLYLLFIFEGVLSPKRIKLLRACFHTWMKFLNQLQELFLFSKLQFLERDDKHVRSRPYTIHGSTKLVLKFPKYSKKLHDYI